MVWVAVVVGLGALAPRVEHALSGAGWEASGSESVQAREQIDDDFRGAGSYALQVVVSSSSLTADEPAFRRTVNRVERVLAEDPRVTAVASPERGTSISADRHSALVIAGAGAPPDEMVRAADDLKAAVAEAGSADVEADLAGAAGMWSDFNEANKSAMLKSELISWPVTLAILLLAFGSLAAAGLPLLLTILGLVSAAGMLFVGAQVFDISIWAMNFALMFALALGIDYALFVVARFRQAHIEDGLSPIDAVVEAMDTAGKAVLFSGITVLIALSAVLLVPSPAFRSMAVGIMLAVAFVLAASLTLLPAVLAKLGGRINRLALPWAERGGQRSPRLGRWAAKVWKRPAVFGIAGLLAVVALAWPVTQLDTGMPSITVVPEEDGSRQGFEEVQRGFGAGAPGSLQVIGPADAEPTLTRVLREEPGIARVLPVQHGGGRERARAGGAQRRAIGGQRARDH